MIKTPTTLSGPATDPPALVLAKRAAAYLYETDPDFVVGGCSDVSEVISAWLRKRGYKAEPIYGAARYGKKGWFLHAWLDLDGQIFDPVLWVQNRKMEKYEYTPEPGVAEALRCDVKTIVEDGVKELERAIPKRPIATSISGQKKHNLPACVKGRRGVKVNPAHYTDIFQASEQWPEVAHWRNYDWYLLEDVPLSEFEFSTLEEYEAAAEMDPEQEAESKNISRVNDIIEILESRERTGAPRWPVVLGLDCMVLDGYHRLSASNVLGIETIDVLYPAKKR